MTKQQKMTFVTVLVMILICGGVGAYGEKSGWFKKSTKPVAERQLFRSENCEPALSNEEMLGWCNCDVELKGAEIKITRNMCTNIEQFSDPDFILFKTNQPCNPPLTIEEEAGWDTCMEIVFDNCFQVLHKGNTISQIPKNFFPPKYVPY